MENEKFQIPKIYGMKLHETLTTDYLFIVRVPGGWLYELLNPDSETGVDGSPVFVPLDNEFAEKEVDL